MKEYLEALEDIYNNGYDRADRTGKGRRSLIGNMIKFDLSDGTVPIVTTRHIDIKIILAELFWLIKGSSNTKTLQQMGSVIWNRWSVEEDHIDQFVKQLQFNEDEMNANIPQLIIDDMTANYLNEVGPIYGPNWRNAPISEDTQKIFTQFEHIPSDKIAYYKEAYLRENTIGDKVDFNQDEFELYCMECYTQSVDQLGNLVTNLKLRPYSTRHVVSAWVPAFIPEESLSPQENVLMGRGALAPCHRIFQCYVRPPLKEGDKPQLSLMIVMGSNDFPVGAPYNIAQYGILLHLLAHVTDMVVGQLIYTLGDYHCYQDQLDQIPIQLSRKPFPLPNIWINPDIKDLFAFTQDDICIEGYQSHPPIVYPVSV